MIPSGESTLTTGMIWRLILSGDGGCLESSTLRKEWGSIPPVSANMHSLHSGIDDIAIVHAQHFGIVILH